MENKNTRGIKKIIVGITIMFFSLFFSLLVDSNRIEAAGVYQLSQCSYDAPLVEGNCWPSFVSIKIPYYSYRDEYTEKQVSSRFFTSRHTFVVDGNIEIHLENPEPLYGTKTVALFKEGKESYHLTYDSVRRYSTPSYSSWNPYINATINFNDSDLGEGIYYLVYLDYDDDNRMYKLTVDLTPPTVSFSSNSNYTYKQSHSATVTVNDNIGVDYDYLRYAWTTTPTFPQNNTTSSTFRNIDGSTKDTKTITTPSEATGKYYLHIEVRDSHGNTTRATTDGQFYVDNTAPILTSLNLIDEETNMPYTQGTWTNRNVKVEFNCGDSISGMKKCDLYNDSTILKSSTSGGVHIFKSDIDSSSITIRMVDNAGNESYSYMTIRIDKTIKSVEFDRSTINKLAFSVDGLVSTKSPLKTMEVYVNGVPLSNVTIPTNQNKITYATFNFYGIYNVSVITEDTAGNIGTFAHVIRYENPVFSLDEITVGYGSGSATHTTGLQKDDSDVYFASVRNDGTNPSKIESTSTISLYNQFFGAGAFSTSTSVKYKINNDETLRSLTNNNEIEIPAIGSGSCSDADDYVTCARIDTITLVVEASGIQVIQRILIISLDVRPVDVSAGSGTQSVNLNVGQVYEVEPLSFDSQIGNEIVSIDETIEFNGEVVDSIDTNKIGTYTITTIATDSEGFKSLPVVRTIVIKDSIPPTISLIGEQTITIKKGQTYVDEGSLAIDNVDGEITVYGSGEVNYNKAGTYEITYQYIDSNGNVSEVVTRTIIVKPDYAKYVILALSSITVLGIAFILIKKFNVKTSY